MKKVEIAEVYPEPKTHTAPTITILHPPRTDTVADPVSNSKKLIVSDHFGLDKLADSITVSYLDTLLRSRLEVYENGRRQRFVTGMSVQVYHANGETYQTEFNGDEMMSHGKIRSFIRKAPVGSYLVLRELYLYNGARNACR